MDQESRDANSLLVELDRGLQSQNVVDQGEAVVRFTSLFQRHPLPIIINSACLKLAEAFRCGTNFIRIQICEVFERNRCHLNKIYNVDDLFRNLFTVTTSNDPIARSITLLTLGHIAPIVSEHKSIHHCIINSLESPVECELNATISCAASYVQESADFACNIYPKIVSIIDSPKSSNELKIRALSVLDHGWYNANDALVVRSFLIDVIERTNLKKLTCACLTLSTKIAHNSLTHITPQIDLLLKIFLTESRLIIKRNALENLRFLAEKSPHIWSSSHLDPLISHLNFEEAELKGDNKFIRVILSIICRLLNCQCNFILHQEKNLIFEQCYKLSLNHQNIEFCSMAFEILTIMFDEHHHSNTIIPTLFSKIDVDTLNTVKTFLSRTSHSQKSVCKSQRVSCPMTKNIYRHIVKLCRINPQYCPEIMKLIFNKISNSKETLLSESNAYLTELLCAILQFSSSETIITPDNCWKLIKTKSSEMSDKNLLNLCILYFQLSRLDPMHEIAINLVNIINEREDLWFTFKVLRQAMRYGHFEIAGQLCNYLHEHVANDTMDFYFKGLKGICAAETLLSQSDLEIDQYLKDALPLYEDSMSPLRASFSNSRTTKFQLQYLWLRIKTLQTHNNLRQCCKIYSTSPVTYATLLDAIGQSRCPGGDQGLSKLGIIQQMPKISKDFRFLSESYEDLSYVSFNCDDRTLDYINLLKISCIVMADVIDAVFQYGKNLPIISKLSLTQSNRGLAIEHRDLEVVCEKLIDSIGSGVVKHGLTASKKSIEPIITQFWTFSKEVLKCPFIFPRYFFQPIQMTTIKLAITPQPNPTQSMALMLNHNLVLKVEGLIQDSTQTNLNIRKISKVIISVSMNPANLIIDKTCNLSVQSAAVPRNNYFKTEFLLPLKIAGSFNVDIDVSIIDEDERLWKTGPTERLSLVVS